MPTRILSSLAVVAAVLFTGVASTLDAQQRWTVVRPGKQEGTEKILASLDEKTSVEFVETPLHDVLGYLSELHKVPIFIDTRSVEAVGIGADTPVTRQLQGVSLRAALRLMLRDLDLTYVVADEVLQITTLERADSLSELQVYNVAPMLEKNEPADHLALTLERVLAKPQRRTPMNPDVPPGSTRNATRNKAGTITVYGQLLIVRDTLQGHRELAELLDAISDAQVAFDPAVVQPAPDAKIDRVPAEGRPPRER